MRKIADLPNGNELFVEDTEYGRAYWSGEIGAGVPVWHTALVAESTLLAALVEEHRVATEERWTREKARRDELRRLAVGELEKHEI